MMRDPPKERVHVVVVVPPPVLAEEGECGEAARGQRRG